jgi:hypothetical protein
MKKTSFLVAAGVLILRESFASMFGLWSLSSYQHAYIVPPMSLLLTWMRRSLRLSVGPQRS